VCLGKKERYGFMVLLVVLVFAKHWLVCMYDGVIVWYIRSAH